MKKSLLGLLTLFLAVFLVSQAIPGIWTASEFLYKPSVGARGTTEKNSFDAGLDQVDTRLGKEIWMGDPNYGTTIQDAVSNIGSNNVSLHIPAGTCNITNNLAIPANIHLKLERGAILNIATDKTLTIYGALEAGLYKIFTCTGTGKVVFGAGAVKEVYPQWWGAVGNGTTDDYAAFAAALTACPTNGTVKVLVPSVAYAISQTIVITSPVRIIGEGVSNIDITGPRLLWTGGATPVIILTALKGPQIHNIVITGAGVATYGLYIDRAVDGDFSNITIDGPATACIYMTGSPTVANDNSHFNAFKRLNLRGPAGMILDGGAVGATAGNCCHNTFVSIKIAFTGAYGLYLKACDNNSFQTTYIYRNSGTGVGCRIGADAYDNYFYHIEPGLGGLTVDTPASVYLGNTIFGYDMANGTPAPTGAGVKYLTWTATGAVDVDTDPRWSINGRIIAAYNKSSSGIISQNYDVSNPSAIKCLDSTGTKSVSLAMNNASMSSRPGETEIISTESKLNLTPGGVVCAQAINITAGQFAIKLRPDAPPDAEIPAGFVVFWINESTGVLTAKAKYTSGAVHSLAIGTFP